MTRYAIEEEGRLGGAFQGPAHRSGVTALRRLGVAALVGALLLLVLVLPGASTGAQAQTIGSFPVYYTDETGSFPHSSWGPVGCDPSDTGSALNVTPGSSVIEVNHTTNFFTCWSSGPFAGPIPAGTWTVSLWLHTYAGIGSNNQIRYELWILDSDDPTAFPAGVRCVTGGVFDCDPTIGTESFVVTNTAPQEYQASFSIPAVNFTNYHYVSYLFPAGEVNRTFLFTYNGTPGSTGDSGWTVPISVPALAPDYFALGASLIVIVTAMAFLNLALKEEKERRFEDMFFLLIMVVIVVVALGAWLASR